MNKKSGCVARTDQEVIAAFAGYFQKRIAEGADPNMSFVSCSFRLYSLKELAEGFEKLQRGEPVPNHAGHETTIFQNLVDTLQALARKSGVDPLTMIR